MVEVLVPVFSMFVLLIKYSYNLIKLYNCKDYFVALLTITGFQNRALKARFNYLDCLQKISAFIFSSCATLENLYTMYVILVKEIRIQIDSLLF